jgi:hypothetical protein
VEEIYEAIRPRRRVRSAGRSAACGGYAPALHDSVGDPRGRQAATVAGLAAEAFDGASPVNEAENFARDCFGIILVDVVSSLDFDLTRVRTPAEPELLVLDLAAGVLPSGRYHG